MRRWQLVHYPGKPGFWKDHGLRGIADSNGIWFVLVGFTEPYKYEPKFVNVGKCGYVRIGKFILFWNLP